MAGYVLNHNQPGEAQFHIDTPNLADHIRHISLHPRVVTLQLDSDELEAALWGLENYRKG